MTGTAAMTHGSAGPAAMGWAYYLGRAAARGVVALAARARIEGAERVPSEGPVLVVVNHTSLADPVVLAALFPRPIAFLAKVELFAIPLVGWYLARAGIIPVRRGFPDRTALERALAVLARGGALAVFAEGTRSRSGVLGRAQPGVGLVAARSSAPVLPVALVGTEQLHSRRAWLSRPELLVRCGCTREPVRADAVPRLSHQQVADELMGAVAALLPVHRRGCYASGGRSSASPG